MEPLLSCVGGGAEPSRSGPSVRRRTPHEVRGEGTNRQARGYPASLRQPMHCLAQDGGLCARSALPSGRPCPLKERAERESERERGREREHELVERLGTLRASAHAHTPSPLLKRRLCGEALWAHTDMKGDALQGVCCTAAPNPWCVAVDRAVIPEKHISSLQMRHHCAVQHFRPLPGNSRSHSAGFF